MWVYKSLLDSRIKQYLCWKKTGLTILSNCHLVTALRATDKLRQEHWPVRGCYRNRENAQRWWCWGGRGIVVNPMNLGCAAFPDTANENRARWTGICLEVFAAPCQAMVNPGSDLYRRIAPNKHRPVLLMQGEKDWATPFEPQPCLRCHCEAQPEVSCALERYTWGFPPEQLTAGLPSETQFYSF